MVRLSIRPDILKVDYLRFFFRLGRFLLTTCVARCETMVGSAPDVLVTA